MPLKDPGTHKSKLLHDNFHYTFDFMMQGKGVMNTHDLGLDLKWTRAVCRCRLCYSEFLLVISNQMYQPSHLLRGFIKYHIHIVIEIGMFHEDTLG